jgi:4-alpha-glucanotransferase
MDQRLMSDKALIALARKAGLDVEWLNYAGEPHTVPPDTLRVVLKALGLPADSQGQIAESNARLDEQQQGIPPLVTAWAGETFLAGGRSFVAPETPGYHHIEIDDAEVTLAVAPHRCFDIGDASRTRLAGLAIQLYALRGGHTEGFGDYAALGEFAVKAARHGIDAIGLSPTHSLFPANPAHFSPYSPSSRIFLNPLYADAGLFGAQAAKDDGREGLIDWPNAASRKMAALRSAYAGFLQSGKRDEFRAFCKEGGERLLRHAIFEVLDAHFRAQQLMHWRAWPQAYRDAAGPAVAEFARAHHDEVDFHRFLQFIAGKSADAAQGAARQAGMSVGIIADIATGIDTSGSDAWSAPDNVLMGLGVGAPPDLINTVGQGWGLTALSPTGLRNDGFAAFIALLRANMAHAGGVRIDHAMSLMRLWVIPDGASPTEGAYLRYPMQDLLRLVALESHQHRAIVIGEDLGTVPHGFREELERRGLAGMQVLWFENERGAFIPPSSWRKDAVAMTTTHDLPTIVGWWRERDIDWRSELHLYPDGVDPRNERRARDGERRALWSALKQAGCAQGDAPPPESPEAVVNGAIEYVGITPCRLAMVPIEDILALEEAPNLPGTVHEHPNWRHRLPPGDPFALAGAESRLERFVRARQR